MVLPFPFRQKELHLLVCDEDFSRHRGPRTQYVSMFGGTKKMISKTFLKSFTRDHQPST
jgi:hypothetical protein